MKFYSEITNKLYSNKKELEAEEEKVAAELKEKEQKELELKAQKEAREKELTEAIEASIKAQQHVKELQRAYLRDFGSYSIRLSPSEALNSLVDYFLF